MKRGEIFYDCLDFRRYLNDIRHCNHGLLCETLERLGGESMLINEGIKHCRVSRGLTQSELAEKLGVSKRYIVYLEQGDKEIKVNKLLQMADILGCSLDELTGRKVRKED